MEKLFSELDKTASQFKKQKTVPVSDKK